MPASKCRTAPFIVMSLVGTEVAISGVRCVMAETSAISCRYVLQQLRPRFPDSFNSKFTDLDGYEAAFIADLYLVGAVLLAVGCVNLLREK